MDLKHHENFWAVTGLRRDFGLIWQIILNMIIHKGFTGPSNFLSANARGPVSFTESGTYYQIHVPGMLGTFSLPLTSKETTS